MSTTYHETVASHEGPKYILWQKGFEHAEKMATLKSEPLIKTGGSVATALLDLMTFFGAQSIALVGQDLAYTGGKSHVSKAPALIEIKKTVSTKKVLNYYQNDEIETANNLIIYKKWFEDYAKRNKQLKLYNCTEGGAHILHWEHIPLREYYKKNSEDLF
jgi:hypothetical protein